MAPPLYIFIKHSPDMTPSSALYLEWVVCLYIHPAQSLLEQDSVLLYSAPQHLAEFLACSKHLTNSQWLKGERKVFPYTEHTRGQNYIRMPLAISYRISATSGLNHKDTFLFHMTQSSESGHLQGWLGSWTVSWTTQMFFIFVLSYPQHTGDLFCYSRRTDVGVPDVICRHDHVQQRWGSVSSCVFLFMTEESLSQMVLADFYSGPVGQDWFTNPSMAGKGYWVDTNSQVHTEMPEEALVGKRRKMCCRRKSSDRGRLKELACGTCNTVCCALFRPIVFLPIYTILSYT